MIRDDLNDDDIIKMLQKDPLGRNQQLSTFIGLLNSIEKNSILTIDGQWGSGKTVFVKQIQYLNKYGNEKNTSFDDSLLEQFSQKYEVYYYNAWQNDYHEDPLQSLLFNLINDFWGTRERLADNTLKVSQAFINSVASTATLGLYNPEELRKATSIKDLVKSITTASERKSAIEDIIENHFNLNGKKILFIVDELDRCKPVFAVKLLEAIKHYYSSDNLVFLLSTNNLELSHTIKKVYGDEFNGIGYLNKFYDLVFNLPAADSEKYANYLGKKVHSGYWADSVPLEIATYLKLSMREINRYYSSLSLISNYMNNTDRFGENNTSAQLVKYVFVPLAYGLRIHDLAEYHKFTSGEGADMVKGFCEISETPSIIIGRTMQVEEEKTIDAAVDIYKKLFNLNKGADRDDYYIAQSMEIFKRIVLLMNASGTIDTADES